MIIKENENSGLYDIEYGLFAQLAYYNWFNYNNNEKNIFQIVSKELEMRLLLQGKSKKFIEGNTPLIKRLKLNGEEKEVKIYKEADKRLFMMYSEDTIDPDNNQKYKEIFQDWELIEGYNYKNQKMGEV
jgi:hypothetical protein